MAEQKTGSTVIIKRIKKGGHGHHGGAWKVAYADFVTAMMAFFLLLWLLNSVTQEQLEGISNYFAPISLSQSTSGAGAMLAGQTLSDEGAMVSDRSPPNITMELPRPKLGAQVIEEDETAQDPEKTDEQKALEAAKKLEQAQFESAKTQLEEAIAKIPSFDQLRRSLLIENTPEGLRIQIVDQEGLAMFPSGSAEMYQHTRRVLELVASVIKSMPQKISIAGHTDATPFAKGAGGYGNWELSADRANAARRTLLDFGVPEKRLSYVTGKAATDPLKKDDPRSATNRRLSITLLRDQNPAETLRLNVGETSSETTPEPIAPAPATTTGALNGAIALPPAKQSLPVELGEQSPPTVVGPPPAPPTSASPTDTPLTVVPATDAPSANGN